jgi:hypothetical protein
LALFRRQIDAAANARRIFSHDQSRHLR